MSGPSSEAAPIFCTKPLVRMQAGAPATSNRSLPAWEMSVLSHESSCAVPPDSAASSSGSSLQLFTIGSRSASGPHCRWNDPGVAEPTSLRDGGHPSRFLTVKKRRQSRALPPLYLMSAQCDWFLATGRSLELVDGVIAACRDLFQGRFGLSVPKRPMVCWLGPAVKNSVVAGPALPSRKAHKPSISHVVQSGFSMLPRKGGVVDLGSAEREQRDFGWYAEPHRRADSTQTAIHIN